MIFEIDASNVGEFSKTWGHILDENYDRFIEYPKVMYLIYTGNGVSIWGIAFKTYIDPESGWYLMPGGYRKMLQENNV